MGGAGADPPMYKMMDFFLIPLALSLPFFTKKSHRTPAVETFKIWPKFESFHSSSPMRFFVDNWYTKAQGYKIIFRKYSYLMTIRQILDSD